MALRDRERIATLFLSGDPMDRDGRCGSDSARVESRSPAQVLAALEGLRGAWQEGETQRVLLHYANYGYAPRGCPFWLIEGLGRWKKRNPRSQLAVMFHELYASASPWRSAFWLSPIQRRLASRLARSGIMS